MCVCPSIGCAFQSVGFFESVLLQLVDVDPLESTGCRPLESTGCRLTIQTPERLAALCFFVRSFAFLHGRRLADGASTACVVCLQQSRKSTKSDRVGEVRSAARFVLLQDSFRPLGGKQSRHPRGASYPLSGRQTIQMERCAVGAMVGLSVQCVAVDALLSAQLAQPI